MGLIFIAFVSNNEYVSKIKKRKNFHTLYRYKCVIKNVC